MTNLENKLIFDGSGPFDLPIMKILLSLDLTTDKKYVLVCGLLENDKTVRIPISLENAMRLLAALLRLQHDLNLPLPELPVQKDVIQ